MVDQQDARLGLQVDQSVAAINSAEDQATGRVMHRLQANEDLDIGAVNAAKEQVEAQLAETIAQNPEIAGSVKLDAAASEVAGSLSDGLPVDQAETVATVRGFGFEPTQVGEALQQRALKTRAARTPSDISYIGRYPAIEDAPPATGRFPGSLGTSAGEVVEYTPATSGLSNLKRGDVEYTVQEGRIGERPARVTALPPGTPTEGLNFPEPAARTFTPEEAAAKLAEFEVSREAQIQNAMARGLSEARAKRNVLMSETQREALESTMPSYSPEDVLSRSDVQSYGDVADAERFSEEMSSKTGRIKALEEGGFLEAQQDPGAARAEPRQVKRGVFIKPASGTSYRGVTGRLGSGVYGTTPPLPSQQVAPGMSEAFGPGAIKASKTTRTELGESRGVTTPERFMKGISPEGRETPEGFVYSGTAMSKPSRVSQRELIAEALEQSSASPEGDVPIPPPEAVVTRGYGPRPSQKPIEASEQIRRIQASNPPEKAQLLINDFLKSLKGN